VESKNIEVAPISVNSISFDWSDTSFSAEERILFDLGDGKQFRNNDKSVDNSWLLLKSS
jgi:hypothetical protein